MKIVIDVADLDCERIDGTRVYIKNILNYLGELFPEDEFFLFHKSKYNKLLKPAKFDNYKDKSLGKGIWWTQWKFARAVQKLKPDVCWMPIQQLPFLVKSQKSKVKSCRTKYVVTIHDLAFKFFPKHFPWWDRVKLNFYTDMAVKKADKIIAISETTRQDLVRLYPEIDERKIEVVYHGFDRHNFQQEFRREEIEKFLEKWGLKQRTKNKKQGTKDKEQKNKKILSAKYQMQNTNYLLYVGAIQPRKDLITLIKAFEAVKQETINSEQRTKNSEQRETNKEQEIPNTEYQIQNTNWKLVLVGEVAWKSEETIKAVENSEFKNDIILTGKVNFKELAMFYRLAKIFVLPSLYEGFGLPILEAMASGIPVITADNSSLKEIGGEAILKFESGNEKELANQIKKLLPNEKLQQELIKKGYQRIKNFSWEKCTRETMEVIRSL